MHPQYKQQYADTDSDMNLVVGNWIGKKKQGEVSSSVSVPLSHHEAHLEKVKQREKVHFDF